MREIKHKIYNPRQQSLESVLTTEPMESDWVFLKVVAVTDYEWVAVFEKLGSDSYDYPSNDDTIYCGKRGCKSI